MTGLTDSMRANFNLMKEINNVTMKSGAERLNEGKKIIKEMSENEKVRELSERLGGIYIEDEPLRC